MHKDSSRQNAQRNLFENLNKYHECEAIQRTCDRLFQRASQSLSFILHLLMICSESEDTTNLSHLTYPQYLSSVHFDRRGTWQDSEVRGSRSFRMSISGRIYEDLGERGWQALSKAEAPFREATESQRCLGIHRGHRRSSRLDVDAEA